MVDRVVNFWDSNTLPSKDKVTKIGCFSAPQHGFEVPPDMSSQSQFIPKFFSLSVGHLTVWLTVHEMLIHPYPKGRLIRRKE